MLWATGVATAALLVGCARAQVVTVSLSQPSTTGTASSATSEQPVRGLLGPVSGAIIGVPDPTFDGYDARQLWNLCIDVASNGYPQIIPDGDLNVRDFALESVAMPGSAPIDVSVRLPVVYHGPNTPGTMVCFIGGGPASPFVISVVPYGF
jgi:hypothetical protein